MSPRAKLSLTGHISMAIIGCEHGAYRGTSCASRSCYPCLQLTLLCQFRFRTDFASADDISKNPSAQLARTLARAVMMPYHEMKSSVISVPR